MKDPIIKEVWKAKETVSKKTSGNMAAHAAQIKKEAAGLRNSAARAVQKQSGEAQGDRRPSGVIS